MLTEERVIASARGQYRAFFKTMAASACAWNFHMGSQGPVLLQQGAKMDVPLPVILRDVHAMSEENMVCRLSEAWRKYQSAKQIRGF